MPDGSVKLGFRAHYPQLETKLTARGRDMDDIRRKLEPVEREVRKRVGNFILAEDDQTLEGVILKRARRRSRRTLSLVETFTSGQMAARLAHLPGAETVFRRGVIARALPEVWAAVGLAGAAPDGPLTPQTAETVARAARAPDRRHPRPRGADRPRRRAPTASSSAARSAWRSPPTARRGLAQGPHPRRPRLGAPRRGRDGARLPAPLPAGAAGVRADRLREDVRIPMKTPAEKAAAFRALHERPGRLRHPEPVGRGHRAAPRLARLRGARHDEPRAGQLARARRRHQRGEPRRGDRELPGDRGGHRPARERGPGERLRRTSRAPPPRSSGSPRRRASSGGSIEDATGEPDEADLRLRRSRSSGCRPRSRWRAPCPCPFMLTARAENLLHGRLDLDDTIRRLQAFEQAGADVLYAPGRPGPRHHPDRGLGGEQAGQRGDERGGSRDHRWPSSPRSA